MISAYHTTKSKLFVRATSIIMIMAFIASLIIPPTRAEAQSILGLPSPGTMVPLSPGYAPVIIKGVKVFPDNPLRFDFIVDVGEAELSNEDLEDESSKLIKYFLASLTVPEEDLWVNLSPYENDRIIPKEFGVTEMGRDLLAQDYVLKQLTASLMYPEEELGGKFWEKIYQKAQAIYGTTDIPVNTFNKVWIVPEKAFVYTHNDMAYVVDSHLKVLLENDYLALNENRSSAQFGTDTISRETVEEVDEVTSSIVKEIILPAIEKEVNEGENFTNLRQIYNSMILATWFKRNLRQSVLSKVYVGQNKIEGVDIEDKNIKDKIYNQYLEAFKKGVYDYIKEEYDPTTQEIIPRKYFSGGTTFDNAAMADAYEETTDYALVSNTVQSDNNRLMAVKAYLDEPAPTTPGSIEEDYDFDMAMLAGLNPIEFLNMQDRLEAALTDFKSTDAIKVIEMKLKDDEEAQLFLTTPEGQRLASIFDAIDEALINFGYSVDKQLEPEDEFHGLRMVRNALIKRPSARFRVEHDKLKAGLQNNQAFAISHDEGIFDFKVSRSVERPGAVEITDILFGDDVTGGVYTISPDGRLVKEDDRLVLDAGDELDIYYEKASDMYLIRVGGSKAYYVREMDGQTKVNTLLETKADIDYRSLDLRYVFRNGSSYFRTMRTLDAASQVNIDVVELSLIDQLRVSRKGLGQFWQILKENEAQLDESISSIRGFGLARESSGDFQIDPLAGVSPRDVIRAVVYLTQFNSGFVEDNADFIKLVDEATNLANSFQILIVNEFSQVEYADVDTANLVLLAGYLNDFQAMTQQDDFMEQLKAEVKASPIEDVPLVDLARVEDILQGQVSSSVESQVTQIAQPVAPITRQSYEEISDSRKTELRGEFREVFFTESNMIPTLNGV